MCFPTCHRSTCKLFATTYSKAELISLALLLWTVPGTKHSLKTSTRHPQWGWKWLVYRKTTILRFTRMLWTMSTTNRSSFGSVPVRWRHRRYAVTKWGLQNAAVYFLFRCLLDVNHGPLNSHPAGSAQVLVRECHVLPTVTTPYAMRNEIKQIESLHFCRTATKSMTMTDREHFWATVHVDTGAHLLVHWWRGAIVHCARRQRVCGGVE